MFECVDKNPDSIPGSAPDVDGTLLNHVEASCTGMPCPPYDPQKELTCAVCLYQVEEHQIAALLHVHYVPSFSRKLKHCKLPVHVL